jgi:mRNA interferase MazF
MSRPLQPRDIVNVQFPFHDPRGREQEGYRPAIVVGQPDLLGVPRYPLIFLVPLTSDKGQPWVDAAPDLYIRFPTGTGNLRSPSIALLDQVRGLDVERVIQYRGTLTPEQYQPILNGLSKMMHLSNLG